MDNDTPVPDCPLCGSTGIEPYHRDASRAYLRCTNCDLVFVPPEFHLSPEAEKAEYNLHRNDPDDPGYRQFLGRLTEPLFLKLPPRARGLDFGCGPGPALPLMLEEFGCKVDRYDPYYDDNRQVFDNTYDFITASEVLEHLSTPRDELERLFNILKPGGTLGIMTKLVTDREAFRTWHYIRDRTHIAFFSRAAFGYIADRFGCKCDIHGNDVVILSKQGKSTG